MCKRPCFISGMIISNSQFFILGLNIIFFIQKKYTFINIYREWTKSIRYKLHQMQNPEQITIDSETAAGVNVTITNVEIIFQIMPCDVMIHWL